MTQTSKLISIQLHLSYPSISLQIGTSMELASKSIEEWGQPEGKLINLWLLEPACGRFWSRVNQENRRTVWLGFLIKIIFPMLQGIQLVSKLSKTSKLYQSCDRIEKWNYFRDKSKEINFSRKIRRVPRWIKVNKKRNWS